MDNPTGSAIPDLRRVLVVDDSAAARHALKTILATMSIRADEVGNGLEAIEFCKRSPAPDLILLDMEMPVMDGLQFLRTLRSDRRWDAVRVIICSGTANLAAVREAMNMGADEYVSKPFTETSIRDKVSGPRSFAKAIPQAPAVLLRDPDELEQTLTRFAAVAGHLVEQTASLPAVQNELRNLSAGLYQLTRSSRMPVSNPGSNRTLSPPPTPSYPAPTAPFASPPPVSPPLASVAATSAVRSTKGTILVVDDSEAVLAMVRSCLEPKGIKVVTTTSPVCSHLITVEKPDLVLLDVEMPGLGGDQMSEAISRSLERISGGMLLFYSGLPPEKLGAVVARNRVQGSISKSLPARQFIELVEDWLSRARARIATVRTSSGTTP